MINARLLRSGVNGDIKPKGHAQLPNRQPPVELMKAIKVKGRCFCCRAARYRLQTDVRYFGLAAMAQAESAALAEQLGFTFGNRLRKVEKCFFGQV